MAMRPLQLGFEEQATRKITRRRRATSRRLASRRCPPSCARFVWTRPRTLPARNVGDVLTAGQIFKAGDVVDVCGVTKGKGYQGVMKLHKMAGDTDTHGTHEFFRHGGSIGCRLTPGRVHKGKRMSARMGTNNYTSSDLVVVKILEDKNVVIVKGSVPGPINGVVVLKGSTKNVKKYIVPQAIKEIESKNPMKASKKGQTAAQKK
jgi:large subunit ribosomal protein L3